MRSKANGTGILIAFQFVSIFCSQNNSLDGNNETNWKTFTKDLLINERNRSWVIFITDVETDSEVSLLSDLMEERLLATSFRVRRDPTNKDDGNIDLLRITELIISWVPKSHSLHIVVKCIEHTTRRLIEAIREEPILCSLHVRWLVFLIRESDLMTILLPIARDVDLWLLIPSEEDLDEWIMYKVLYNEAVRYHVPQRLLKWTPSEKFTGENSTWLGQVQPKTFLGKTINIALEQHFPFFIPSLSNNTISKGADIDLLEAMGKTLKFSYNIVRPPDGKWGSLVNGTWNGMIGQVYREEVDAALGGMTITVARNQAATFSTPYAYDRTTFIGRAPSEITKAWVIFRPLQPVAWLTICGMAVLVAVLLGVAEKILFQCKHHASLHKRSTDGHASLGKRITFGDTFMYTYRSFFYQECYNPEDISTRIFVISWWIFVITVIAGYNGHLVSFMTNPGVMDAVDTIEKLVAAIRKGHFTCGTIKDSSDHNIFKMGDSENFAIILRSMESDPHNFVHHDVEGLARALKMNYVYIAGHLTVDADIKRPELFRFAKDSFQFSGYGIAMRKGFWHTELINKQILRLREFGLLDKWIEKHIESRRDYWANENTDLERKLHITDVQGAFFLLAIGLVTSVTAGVVEILHYRRKRRVMSKNAKRDASADSKNEKTEKRNQTCRFV